MVAKTHIDSAVLGCNEFQKLYVGKVVVRNIARDAAHIRRQKIPFEEILEILTQQRNCPAERRVKIYV
jgi:hypothetical protein